jgi:RNA polymerase sigma factor for flagellar operon FliA
MSSVTEPRLTRDQQALVERAAHRVPQIARQIRHLLGGISLEECESAGYEALVRSALRFDPSLGVPFTGYCYPRVRGAMLDAARRVSPDRRRLARAIKLVESVEAARQNHQASALAGDPRSLRERVEAAAAMIREVTTAVVLTRIVNSEPELLADESSSVDEVVADEHTRAVVKRAMERCEPEEQALLAALYFGEQTMHEYAAAIGVNVSTVSRRHSRALAKLAAWFAERPP